MARKKKDKQLPTEIHLPNKDIDYLANDIVERRDSFARDRAAQYEGIWQYNLKYYECRSEEPYSDWMSRVFLPLIYRDFRTIYPRLRKLLIGNIPLMKCVGAPNENLEKYISTCIRKNKGYLALSDILWESTMYGTGIGKVFWDTDYTVVEKRVPKVTPGENIIERAMAEKSGIEDETLEYESKEETVLTLDQPIVCWVPLWNFQCNGNEASEIDDVDCCEEMFVDLNYLKARSKNPDVNPFGAEGAKWGIYDNVEKIAEFDEIVSAIAPADDPQNKIRTLRGESNINANRKYTIKLLCFQGDFEHQNKFYRNGIATIAQVSNETTNFNLTLRVRPATRSDGRKNYFKINYERVPGRFYGRSLPEVLIDIQEFMNDFCRGQMNRETMALHKQIFYDATRIENPAMLQLRMGGLAPVGGPPNELIKEQDIDPASPSSWQITEFISNWALEASGAYRNLAGGSEPANRTASGIQSMLGQAQERILDTAREQSESLADCGEALVCTILDAIASDAPKKIEFAYVNNKGKEEKITLTSEDVPKNIEIYVPTIFERGDKQTQANQIIQLMPVFAQDLDQDQSLALKKRAWKQLEFEGEDELFNLGEQSIPLEVVQAAMQRIGVPQEVLGAALNQLAMEQQQGGNGEGSGRSRAPAKTTPDQGQGTANVPMPMRLGANRGRA